MARTTSSPSSTASSHTPSSPHSPPIGNLFIKNDGRLASVNYCTLGALRVAAETLIGDRRWQYAGSKRITLSGTSAVLESDIDIDDIMEAAPAANFDFALSSPSEYIGMLAILENRAKRTLPEPSSNLMRDPANVVRHAKEPKPRPVVRKSDSFPADRIRLADLCSQINLDTKHARSNLRDAGEPKPAEHGWHFATDDIERIKAIITKPR